MTVGYNQIFVLLPSPHPLDPRHRVLLGLPRWLPCPPESQALPHPRPRGQSGGCHPACRLSSCTSSHRGIPTSHLPPQKAKPQVGLSSTHWQRASAEEPDGRGGRVTTDRRSFRSVAWRLRAATPSRIGLKPSSVSSVGRDLRHVAPAPSSSEIGRLGCKWPCWGALPRAEGPASRTGSALQ